MVGAIVASVSGYLLSRGSGGYDEELLSWHKWLGIGVAVLSIVLYFLHLRTINGTNKLFFPLFGLTILLLSAAGHYGGSITHGADFLSPSTSAVKVQKEINDIENAGIFADLIQPILDTKCVSCHRSSKTKGELLMSTIEGINAGGESGALFV